MIGDQYCPKCSSLIKEEWFIETGLPVEDAMAYGEVSFHCPFCGAYIDVDVEMSISLKVQSSEGKTV